MEDNEDGARIQQLFGTCDLDGSGYIDRHELAAVCDLSESDLSEVFYQLDLDNDGKISIEEFSQHFQTFSNVVNDLKTAKGNSEVNRDGPENHKSFIKFKKKIGIIESSFVASQQYISELYYNLTNSNQPELLELFEKHLSSVVKDIKSRAAENQRLEEALKRATKQHARQVNNLDREVEQQMENLEAKVRQEEKSLSEKKLSDLQWQLESKEKEIAAMNKTIDTLHSRMSKETTRTSRKDEINSLSEENRCLRSQVTDSQTTVALLRSELAQLRSEFVEQSELLQKEQRTSHDCLQEQENLARQLQLLHEANQKLHDVNDELRGALEAKRNSNTPQKQNWSEILRVSGVFSDPGYDLSSSIRSNTSGRCHSATPSLGSRLPGQNGECYENGPNEDSLFSEIHRASTIHQTDTPTSNGLRTTNDDTTVDSADDLQKTSYTETTDGISLSQSPISQSDKLRASNTRNDVNTKDDDNLPICSKTKNDVLAKIMTTLASRNSKSLYPLPKMLESNGNFSALGKQHLEKSTENKTRLLHNLEVEMVSENVEANKSCQDMGVPKLKRVGSHRLISRESARKDKPTFCRGESVSSVLDENLGSRNGAPNAKATTRGHANCFETFANEPKLQTLCSIEEDSLEDANSGKLNKDEIWSNLTSMNIVSQDSNDNYQDAYDGIDDVQLTSTSVEIIQPWREGFSSKQCTYEEFEELLETDKPAGIRLYSSPSSSFALTSVSSLESPEPYKSDPDEDEAYGTMSKSRQDHIQKQIQILEDTNKRLSSSNDELRVALKLMARSGSFRKSKKSGIRRTPSSHSDYGSLSSRSSRCFSPKQKRSSPGDVGEATDESTTYDVEDDDNVATIAEETTEDLGKENEDLPHDNKDNSLDDFIITRASNNSEHWNGLDKLEDDESKSPENFYKIKNVDDDNDDDDDDDDDDNDDDDDDDDDLSKSSVTSLKPTRHESLECVNEKPLLDRILHTRSKSLELFYLQNLKKLRNVNDSEGNLKITQKRSDSTKEENNNDGLWDITRKLNAYEQIRSQSSLEELNRTEEGNVTTSFGCRRDEDTTYGSSEDETESSSESSQVSDSTTMNSETIADLEGQLLKIEKNQDEDKKSKRETSKDDDNDDDDDDDDDEEEDEEDEEDVNSAELAELVAMASDLSDVSESDSELESSRDGVKRDLGQDCQSTHEDMSTMTTNSLEVSVSYGTPERMYKLVLAGDAAVGKSSFILRLCKNKFHCSLNATLGVDFQVKNIKVDSKTVALQLWDTAGQERFRSIAKSYFRKVDGVLLLYDVTCESSFINIRDWMQTIEESAHKKVPVMLCGNKCDLRDEYIREGRKVVTRESGQRLAKRYDALFVETSAKEGVHIEDACEELARILTSLENQEIEESGLKLDKRDREKKKRPCCPS